ncbi:hypothetical protein T4D_4277 [Trichinella pseudospiralis]|uniref:Uncharacterized protein n=1 Tax=Trichinella pseudospiralis TaxID=6337 RepID=A0A0V1FUG3_TRIPS|nr:hypothetical protein T4D_4277 [Trichinella pseudospiralis]
MTKFDHSLITTMAIADFISLAFIRNQLLSAMHSIVMGQVRCGFFELPLRHYRSQSDLIFKIRKMPIICL